MTIPVLNARLPGVDNVLLVKGEDFVCEYWVKDQSGNAMDWNGAVVEMEFLDDAGVKLLSIPDDAGTVTLDLSDPPTGGVKIKLPRADVANIAWTCAHMIVWVTDSLGERYRQMVGLGVVSDGTYSKCPT